MLFVDVMRIICVEGRTRSKTGEDVGICHIFSSPLISTMTSVEESVCLKLKIPIASRKRRGVMLSVEVIDVLET